MTMRMRAIGIYNGVYQHRVLETDSGTPMSEIAKSLDYPDRILLVYDDTIYGTMKGNEYDDPGTLCEDADIEDVEAMRAAYLAFLSETDQDHSEKAVKDFANLITREQT